MQNQAIARGAVETYKFGPFILDRAQRRLTKAGEVIALTVKTFDLLVFLVSNHGKLLGKNEILDQVWEGAETYEASLTAHISMLRQALGETKEHPYIETVTKKGYRFIAPVELVPNSASLHLESDQRHETARPHLRRLYFAVLVVSIITFTAIAGSWWQWKQQTPWRLYQQAIQLERHGNDRDALESLDRALSSQPHFDEANLRAAWICYDDNANDEASKYIRAINGDPDKETGHRRSVLLQAKALRILLSGDQNDALHKLQLAADTDPGDTDSIYALSELQMDMGLLNDADQSLTKCGTLDSRNPFCAYLKVSLRVYQNRFKDALSEYDQAYANGAANPWLDQPAGYARLGLNDPDGALKLFRKVEEQGKSWSSSVHFRASQDGLAAVQLYRGRLDDARQQMIAALQTSDSDYEKSWYYIRLATIDALHAKVIDAATEVRLARTLSNSPDLAIPASRALAMSGEYELAADILRQHSKDSALFGRSYPAAEQFLQGLHAISKRDWAKAESALANSYRFEPTPEAAYYLARAQMFASHWNDAASTLKNLLDARGKILMDSSSSLVPLAEHNLGICYQHLGDRLYAESLINAARTQWQGGDREMRGLLKP